MGEPFQAVASTVITHDPFDSINSLKKEYNTSIIPFQPLFINFSQNQKLTLGHSHQNPQYPSYQRQMGQR